MEDDDMFEGMVLFTPSQVPDDVGVEVSNLDVGCHKSQSEAEASSTKKSENDDDNTSNSHGKVPLDENLFSDLTLQTLSPQSDPIPSAITRRKKKRAASLRIGYARDSSSLDDDLPSQSIPDAVDSASDDNNKSNLNDSNFPTPTTAAAATTTTTSLADRHPPELEREPDTSSTSVSDSQSSIDAQYELIKSQISDKLQHSRQLPASVSAARKDAIRKRRKAAQDLNSASSKIRDLELQLEAACESEDFDAAQRISDYLASANKERLAFLTTLKDAEAYYDAIDSKMLHVLNSQIVAKQECAALLSDFAKDAENNADLIVKNALSLSSKESDEWFSSLEALEAKKIELAIESHFIDEARLAVSDSIEHSVEDYRKEQEILRKKHLVLTDELKELVNLVKLKEMEIAENDSNIRAVEEKIVDVVSSFQENRSSIDTKYDNLQRELSKMHSHSEALSMKRKDVDKYLADVEAHGTKLRGLAKVSKDEAKTYQEVVELRQSLMMPILKYREEKVRLAKSEEELIENVQLLQQEVSSARASLQELSSTKSNIQQTIASFKQRIFFIDKRVPELEAEKKVAAAARNFKEAARIAAVAKSLSVEKDGMEIELGKATLELEKLEEDIKSTVTRLQNTEQLISSKEKEVAMARFQSLLLIAGAAAAERFAALELDDTEEANLLLAEADAANAEAEKLRLRYNFNEDEFSNLPKHFISVELLSELGQKRLVELAASVLVSKSE